jgi:hypothetical protein
LLPKNLEFSAGKSYPTLSPGGFQLRREQNNLDVAETFSIRQLGESHGDELIPTREPATLVVAALSLHAGVEVAAWKKIQDLRKHVLPVEHKTTLPFPVAENPPTERQNVLPI